MKEVKFKAKENKNTEYLIKFSKTPTDGSPGRTMTILIFLDKLYCHTHEYGCTNGHDSGHYLWPEKEHCKEATMEIPMGRCTLSMMAWEER